MIRIALLLVLIACENSGIGSPGQVPDDLARKDEPATEGTNDMLPGTLRAPPGRLPRHPEAWRAFRANRRP